MTKKIIIVLLSVILCLGLVACSNDKDSQYTLTFYGFDGKTEVTTMEISGDRIEVPEAPKIEGYTFVGWYLDSPDSTLKVDAEFFMRNSANKDRVAYARYKANTYNVTFYSGEYKIAIMSAADIIDKGQDLPVPPPNPYYVFEGWYLESGVKFTPEYLEENSVEKDLNVYAKYTREQYTLTFVVDGEVYATMQVSDQEITLPLNPEHENEKLEFAYWLPVGSTLPITANKNNKSEYFVENPATKSMTVEAVFIDVDSDFQVIPSGLDTCTITGYTGTDKVIVVPAGVHIAVGNEYKYYTVEAIDDRAFAYNTTIESVVINDNVNRIGSFVFSGCSNLKSVTFGGVISADNVGANIFNRCYSITDIAAPIWVVSQLENMSTLVNVKLTAGEKVDDNMFEDATKLESVVFTEGLKEIGSKAFAGCTALKSIHIPASVNSIAIDAYAGCSAVETITVDAANETYTSGDDANCIVKKNFVEVEIEGEVEGETVTELKLDSMTLIVGCANTTIFSGINEIAEYAFVNCVNLKNVFIPASVTNINENAFVGSVNIESITAEDSEYYVAIDNCLIALSKDDEGKSTNRLILGCQNSVVDADLDITSISKNAFAGCAALKVICIPAGVASVEEGSFDGCIAVESIIIANENLEVSETLFADCVNVKNIEVPMEWLSYFLDGYSVQLVNITLTTGTEIPKNCFSGCSALTTVTLPDTIETIGAYAFSGCNKLTRVVITENSALSTIGRSAFEYCYNFVAIAYDSQSDTFVVPASVKSVGDYAFKNTAIKNLEFAEGCTLAVAYKVFANCSSLVSVSISSTVSSVDFDAFTSCNNIDTVSTPAEFIRVFSNARNTAIKTLIITEGKIDGDCYYIREMTNLENLVIGAGVTDIDNKAFEGCSKLKSIEVAEGNMRYTGEGNCIIETARNLLVLGCNSSEIPAAVKTISSYAFAQSNITAIIIPANVTKIEDYAFSSCRKLADITIESENTVIGVKAFDGCDKVTDVTIPANAIEYIAQVSLRKVVITSGTVKAGAFEDCLTLNYLVICPDVVVEDGAFAGCINITTLTAPVSALAYVPAAEIGVLTINKIDADIEAGVMIAYEDLEILTIDVVDATDYDIGGLKSVTTVTKASIPAWAICSMPESLVELVITSGVVENRAELPALKTLSFANGVTAIGDGVFADYKTLTSVSLSETLTTIGNGAFAGCTGLKSLDLSYVTVIGNGAFAGCRALNSVITTSLVTVGEGAFADCTSLTVLDLPCVENIGAGAFAGCTGLTEVSAPAVTAIGEDAFVGCEFTVAAVPALVVSYLPESVTTLTVTSGKVEAEDGADVELPNLETLIFGEDVTEIGNNAFANCKLLAEVTLPETLTVIGAKAFYGCELLASIDLSNVEKIYDSAFEGCKALTELDLTGIQELGIFVFDKDIKLTKATVPAFVLPEMPYYITELVVVSGELGTNALQYVYDLEALTIGADVTYVAADAIREGVIINTVIVDENNNYYRFEDNKLININDEVVWDFNA